MRQDGPREDEVLPADLGLDAPGKPLEAGGVLGPCPRVEMPHVHVASLGTGLEARRLGGPFDLVRIEAELDGDQRRVQVVRRRTVQSAAPDRRPLVQAGEGSVEQERYLARPDGVPASNAEQDDRTR